MKDICDINTNNFSHIIVSFDVLEQEMRIDLVAVLKLWSMQLISTSLQ